MHTNSKLPVPSPTLGHYPTVAGGSGVKYGTIPPPASGLHGTVAGSHVVNPFNTGASGQSVPPGAVPVVSSSRQPTLVSKYPTNNAVGGSTSSFAGGPPVVSALSSHHPAPSASNVVAAGGTIGATSGRIASSAVKSTSGYPAPGGSVMGHSAAAAGSVMGHSAAAGGSVARHSASAAGPVPTTTHCGTITGSKVPGPPPSATKSHHPHASSSAYPHPVQEAPKERRTIPHLPLAPQLGSGGIDICFVMDCTGSMAPWIEAAKATIKDMIASLADERHKRVAFVAYRDFANGLPEAVDFTENVDKIIGFINGQRATGGADFPEDVAGGLASALGLSWTSETRSVVLVCDAPCHGEKYLSAPHHDDFPAGDPTGLSMTALLQSFRMAHIDFTFVQLTPETEVMQRLLRDAYDKTPNCTNIRRFELRDLQEILQEFGGSSGVAVGGAEVTSMLSAAVMPSIASAVQSTKRGVAVPSVDVRTSYASMASGMGKSKGPMAPPYATAHGTIPPPFATGGPLASKYTSHTSGAPPPPPTASSHYPTAAAAHPSGRSYPTRH